MRVATWNLKQAMAPRLSPVEKLWDWAVERIDPDVMIFTEAKVPKSGVPMGWNAVFTEGGIDKHRRWGTIVAGRGVELVEVTTVQSCLGTQPLEKRWPAAVQVADVMVRGQRWATVVGAYALTRDLENNTTGHGAVSLPVIFEELKPLIESRKGERLVMAGDFNLWPKDVRKRTPAGLVDLVDGTAHQRSPLPGCSGCGRGGACGHMWTHKNGGGPTARVQHIDYILGSPRMARDTARVWGGVADFPDVWEVSDHAPVVAEFSLSY